MIRSYRCAWCFDGDITIKLTLGVNIGVLGALASNSHNEARDYFDQGSLDKDFTSKNPFHFAKLSK